MAQTFTRGVTPLAVGQQQFIIDGLPNDSEGFVLRLGVSPSWEAASGELFRLTVEDALDGVTFTRWFTTPYMGGPQIDRWGQPLAVTELKGYWKGQNDGNGGRQKLRAMALRATLDVFQAVTLQSVEYRTF